MSYFALKIFELFCNDDNQGHFFQYLKINPKPRSNAIKCSKVAFYGTTTINNNNNNE